MEDIFAVQYRDRLQELSGDQLGFDPGLCRVRVQILPEITVLDEFHCDVDVVRVFEPSLERHTPRVLICR